MESIERDGYTIEIRQEDYDLDCFNPRDYDNVTTLVCWHPDYVLGDFQFTNPDGRGAVGGRHGRGKDTSFQRDDFTSMEQLARYLGIVCKAVAITPLYLYDHSGITMSAGTPNAFDSGGWDTTMVGFAYTTHERVNELCGTGAEYHTDEWLAKAVRSEVAVYDQYLTGDVYWYSIEHKGETIDSLGGIFGYEYAVQEANEAVDALVAERKATIEHGMHKWHYIAKLLAGSVAA